MSTEIIQKHSNEETDRHWQIPDSPCDLFTHFIRNFFTPESQSWLLDQDRKLPYRIVKTCFHFSPHALIRWGQANSAPLTPFPTFFDFISNCQLTARTVHTLLVQKEERMDKDLLIKTPIHPVDAYPGVTIQDLYYPQILPLLQTREKKGEEIDDDLLNFSMQKSQELSTSLFKQIEEKITELQNASPVLATREELFPFAVEKIHTDFNEPTISQLENELFEKTPYSKLILIQILDIDGSPYHVFDIEVLPAEGNVPQQYRIYQSFQDFFTLSEHLQRNDPLLEEEQMRSFYASFRTIFCVENRKKGPLIQAIKKCFSSTDLPSLALLHFDPESRHLGGFSLSFIVNIIKNPLENAIEFLQEQAHRTTLASLIAERILEINTRSYARSDVNYFRVLFDLYRFLKLFENESDLSYFDLANQLKETYLDVHSIPTSLPQIQRSTYESFVLARTQFAPTLPEDITPEEVYSYANKHYQNIAHKLRA